EWSRARAYLAGGRIGEAVLLLDELVEREPERDDFFALLAYVFFAAGLNDEAAELLGTCGGGDGPGLLLLKAEHLRRVGEIAQSGDLLRRVAENPRLPAGLAIHLATAFLRVRDFAKAAEIFSRVVEENRKNAAALAGLGYCCVRGRRLEDAESLARESVGAAYHFAWAHFVLGLALAGQGRVREAIECFERAVEMNPHLGVARLHLVSWLRRTHAPAERIERQRGLLGEGLASVPLSSLRETLRGRLLAGRRKRLAARRRERGLILKN
ncbi:MAG: tetratricopeptide repeat protein, partial [Chthoniobacterales bacterium]